MRKLFAVLSCLAIVVLVALVAVCGVVGLPEVPALSCAEGPMEAGLTLAEVAPEFAECPLGATALEAEHLNTHELSCTRCSLDHALQVAVQTEDTRTVTHYPTVTGCERLKCPTNGATRAANDSGTNEKNLGVWRAGVHTARG